MRIKSDADFGEYAGDWEMLRPNLTAPHPLSIGRGAFYSDAHAAENGKKKGTVPSRTVPYGVDSKNPKPPLRGEVGRR